MTDKNVMTNEEIIAECRKRGLQSGASLGSHSGFMELVADRLEELLEENQNQKIKIDKFRTELRENSRAMKEALSIAEELNQEIINVIKEEKIKTAKDMAERLKETKCKHDNDYIIYADNIDVICKKMEEEIYE